MRRSRHLPWFPLLAALLACGGPPAAAPTAAPRGATWANEGSVVGNPPPAPPTLRLPDTVVPTGYALRLEVDPDREDFRGHVDIDVRVTAASRHVWLHAHGLTITAPAVTVGGTRSEIDPLPGRHDVVGFALRKTVTGAATLHFDFAGKVPVDEMAGIFREQEAGRWYLYTQLESVFARRVFPSFDEPQWKVPWKVTVVAPDGQVALSNAPAVSDTRLPDGRHQVVFDVTDPLPSYLVAIAVGPFELVDVGPVGRRRIPARIAVLAGTSAHARWAVETTPKLVTALEDYFDIALPYAKLDQVVVPRFFGAMENPGLITYAAPILVAPPGKETDDFKRLFVAIGGHELAHMWFGDLVTLAWWDDTWLNESFATWMADKAGLAIDRTWDAPIRQAEEADEAMAADTSAKARPLRRTIAAQEDIEGAFDSIAYEKGGAVLSMFERWIGPERFRDGVRAYIRDHAHGTATAGDFLDALTAVSTADTGRAFRAFLERPGVPLVRASLTCQGAPTVRVAQARLLPAGETAAEAGPWPLPVCMRYPGGKGAIVERCTLVDTADATVPLETRTCPAWIVANAGASGYYRVAYDADLTRRLVRALGQLQPAERIALAADTGALVDLGHADIAVAFDLARALLARRDEHSVLASAQLIEATRALVDPGHRPAWQRQVRSLFGARARALGFAPLPAKASTAARKTRQYLLGLVAVQAEDPALIAQARPRAEAWLAGKGGIELDDLTMVLSAAALRGDAALYDAYDRAARASKDTRERTALLSGMARFPEMALVDRTLRILAEGPFDVSETGLMTKVLFVRPDTEARAWAYFKANYDAIAARVPAFARGYLATVAGGFCTDALRREADEFLRPRAAKVANGTRMLESTLEEIDRCVARRARSAAAVEALFGPAAAVAR